MTFSIVVKAVAEPLSDGMVKLSFDDPAPILKAVRDSVSDKYRIDTRDRILAMDWSTYHTIEEIRATVCNRRCPKSLADDVVAKMVLDGELNAENQYWRMVFTREV